MTRCRIRNLENFTPAKGFLSTKLVIVRGGKPKGFGRRMHHKERHTLFYPSHQFKPSDWLRFIHGGAFDKKWHGLGLSDEDLGALQIAIMVRPQAPRCSRNRQATQDSLCPTQFKPKQT